MGEPQRVAGDAGFLRVEDLSLSFGGLRVLDRVSLTVDRGTVCGPVGPNGAGKTSLFNCVSGHYHPDGGPILVDGVDILQLAPHRLAALGVARTFQHPWLDPAATVLDNLLVGGHTRVRGGPLSLALRLPFVRRDEARLRRRALELRWSRAARWRRASPHRPARRQRGGQDHHAARDQRHSAAARPHPLRRPRPHPPAPGSGGPARRRPRAQGPRAAGRWHA